MKFRQSFNKAVDKLVSKAVEYQQAGQQPADVPIPTESEPEPAQPDGQTCSLCDGPMERPPGPNPDALPQCIQCDRKPKGQW